MVQRLEHGEVSDGIRDRPSDKEARGIGIGATSAHSMR